MNNHKQILKLLANCLLLASFVGYTSSIFGAMLKEDNSVETSKREGPDGPPYGN
jgi:hypothetical protein